MADAKEWATAIAIVAVPDEVDLAAATIEAFLAGGARRRELFGKASDGSGVSGFGPGFAVLLLPTVFTVLAEAAALVMPYLVTGVSLASGTISIVTGSMTIRDRLKGAPPEAPAGAASSADAPIADETAEAIAADLKKRLKGRGLTEFESGVIADSISRLLLLDPSAGASFLSEVSAARDR